MIGSRDPETAFALSTKHAQKRFADVLVGRSGGTVVSCM